MLTKPEQAQELAHYHTYVLGSRLRKQRRSVNKSQEAVAKLTGLNATAISHFETGRRVPCVKNLLLLCVAVECSPNKLLLGD